jgi:hypothetical protein
MKQAIDPTANQQGEADSSEGASACQGRFDLLPRDLPVPKPRPPRPHVDGRGMTGGLVSLVPIIGSASIES